jgi:hypothetical protein
MKKITTLLFLFVCLVSFGQSTLTIFNNGGQQFYVILNGIKQNSTPQTNVSVSGINNGSYSVKLIFADGKTGDIDKNFMLDEPSFVTTRVIFKKGKGKLQLIGMEPSNGQNGTGTTIIYRPNNSAVYSDAVVTQTVTTNTQQTTTPVNTQQNGNVTINTSGNGQQTSTTTNAGSGQSQQVGGTTTINTQQTTTTTDPTMQNGNVGINMNVNVTDPTMNNGQGGVNMSINMSGTGVGTNTTVNETQTVNQTTTTTVTTNGTQTTTSGGNQTISTNTNMNGQNTNMNTNANTNMNSSSNQVVSSATSQNFVSCQKIMGDVNVYLKDLEQFNFEEDKMDLTKKDFVGTCMTASQAYKLVEIYTFEANRLEIAKYLYPRIIDKDNAKTIIPLFTFDATKLEYREFIRN